ncbi:MAG: hypothetical protein M1820_010867 [Bogoriella megaspora]|nr:MAG: hypothetical protein M1820_010867 [Bogoriella megaspora]
MQVRILIRALEMLKVGGRVVYSTCSMNPVENEAVIATAIDRCGGLGKIAMIDCSNELPGLVRLPGKFDWKVMDKSGKIWNRWDEVEAANARGETDGTDRLIEGMFPPAASTEGHAIPFDRCMRVYPHLQDTGGFFITVLEKLSEIRTRPENITKNKNNGTSAYGANAENDEQNTTAKPAIGQILHAVESDMSKEEDSKESQPMQALDDVLPLETDGGTDVSSGNAPAAARSNQPNAGVLVQADGKRFAEDELIPDMPAKRAKMEPVPAGGAPNTEHWPLPPAMGVDQTVETSEVRNGEDIVAKSKPKPNQQHEEPFKYLDPDHEELQSIYSFYQLSDRFPRDRFMVRNATGQPVKAIYYTSALARDILTEMEGKGMKFVHCGIKMFVKQDPQKENICRWRIQAEGLPVIEHWVGENRVVRLYKRDTLQKLLKEMFPKIGQNDWQSLGEIGPRVKDMEMGCCVLRVEPSDEVDGDGFRAMLLRLFNDTSPLINTQDRLKKPDPEESRSPSPLKVGSSEPGEASESLFVTNGTYDAARHPNVEEATTIMGLVEPDASEEVALDDENRLLAAAQQEADNTREVAPGVTDEDDVFNQTV